MICIYFIFSMKDGCIQHAHRQIKEVEWLQKLCQSDCQNHIGRPGVLCVQMESESEICLLIGVKGAWCDETTAENSWLAWLWPHLHVSHKRLALIIYFFFFFFSCHVSLLEMCSIHAPCPLWGTSCICCPGPAPGCMGAPHEGWTGRRAAVTVCFCSCSEGPAGKPIEREISLFLVVELW